jgi:hypothetical protein
MRHVLRKLSLHLFSRLSAGKNNLPYLRASATPACAMSHEETIAFVIFVKPRSHFVHGTVARIAKTEPPPP